MRLASLLLLAALPLGAAAQDAARGRLLYETHCGTCHYERVHERTRSEVKGLDDLRLTVAKWAEQTRRRFTPEEIDDVAEYLNESHYRFGLAPGAGRRELIYGAELMSEAELDEYRAGIAAAGSAQAETRLRAQHRERIRERARARGAQLAEPFGTLRR
jgi:hypothetical protein